MARLVTAAALAQYITLLLLESATFWPTLTVLMLSARNVGVTWKRAVLRGIGTAFGFFIAICLVAIFPQTPGALLISFVPVFVICLYLSQTVPTNAYAFFMVIITLTVVVAPAWSDPELVVPRGLYRFFETLTGVFCVSFVSRCVFPISAEEELNKAMSAGLHRASLRFQACIARLQGNGATGEPIEPESRSSFTEKIDLLNAAISESTVVHEQKGLWISRINLTNRVAIQSQMLLDQLTEEEIARIPQSYRLGLIEALQLIRSEWDRVGTELTSGGLPKVDRDFMNQAADKLEGERSHGQNSKRVNAITTTIMMLRQIGEVDDIMLYQITSGSQSDFSQLGLIGLVKKKIRNLNLPSFQLAVKATLATMIALGLIATFRWTNAMSTMAVTTILVMQPTMGASWSKSLQRIIGAFIGVTLGIAGLAIVSANTNDYTWMLLYMGVCLGIASWLMSGSWETSYVGLQIGLASALVLSSAQPTDDVSLGLERVTGVIFGLLIALTILRLLWPVWAGSRVCESMASASSDMARCLESGIDDPEQEAVERPAEGWSYFILSNISSAYKFREEARYERGLTRVHDAPGLTMGIRLQQLLPKIILIVEARQLRSLREDVIFHPAATALRHGVEQRLRLIAQLTVGGEGEPTPLRPLLSQAYESIGSDSTVIAGTNPTTVREFLGYYEDMIPDLDALVDDARQTAELFSEKKGVSRLGNPRIS